MHPLNDACCDALPIFDEWPESFGMEYESDSVVRLHRIADREASKKVPCSGIHPQRVPISIDDNARIRFHLPQKKVHGLARYLHLRCVEAGVAVARSVTGRLKQGVALAQGDFQRFGQTEHHLKAWLRSTCLDTTQVTCRNISIEREGQLANASSSAPLAQQDAKICSRCCVGTGSRRHDSIIRRTARRYHQR